MWYNIAKNGQQSEQEFTVTLFSFLWTQKQAMSLKHDESQEIEEQFILRLPPVSNFYYLRIKV